MPDFLADALTWPNNYSYMLALETAMSLKLPPTVMMLPDRQPADGWSTSDKKLSIAWTILQKELCKECGNPLWICRSSNKNLMFSVRTDICYAKAELERWQKGRKAKNLKPGEHPYLVAKMRSEDEALPTRQMYLSQLTE